MTEYDRPVGGGVAVAEVSHVPMTPEYTRGSLHLLSLFLTLATLGSGVVAIIFAPFGRPIAVIFVGAYLAESLFVPMCTDSVLFSLFNKLQSDEKDTKDHDYFVAARAAPPELWMSIECYHYEKRTRTVGSGKTRRTETHQVKVVTFSRKEQKHFGSWQDMSGPAPKIMDLDPRFFGVLVHVRTAIRYDNSETAEDIKRQGIEFRERYRHHDKHHSFSEFDTFRGHRKAVMLADSRRTPWYVSAFWYVLASLLLCSWPYRMLLRKGVMDTTYVLKSKVAQRPDALTEVAEAIIPDEGDMEAQTPNGAEVIPEATGAQSYDYGGEDLEAAECGPRGGGIQVAKAVMEYDSDL